MKTRRLYVLVPVVGLTLFAAYFLSRPQATAPDAHLVPPVEAPSPAQPSAAEQHPIAAEAAREAALKAEAAALAPEIEALRAQRTALESRTRDLSAQASAALASAKTSEAQASELRRSNELQRIALDNAQWENERLLTRVLATLPAKP